MSMVKFEHPVLTCFQVNSHYSSGVDLSAVGFVLSCFLSLFVNYNRFAIDKSPAFVNQYGAD
jgi:hypothetical protein